MNENYDMAKIADYRCRDCGHPLSEHTPDLVSSKTTVLKKDRPFEEERSEFVVVCKCRKRPCSWKIRLKAFMQFSKDTFREQNQYFDECFAYFFWRWKKTLSLGKPQQ